MKNFIQKPIFNIILFVLTFITTTLMGIMQWSLGFFIMKAKIANDFLINIRSLNDMIEFIISNKFLIFESLKYSFALLIFLFAHEMGHYLACRYYGISATLPYFLPVPIGFGTLGAVIKIKAPIPNKKVLFDIGIAGPLAGFIVLLPILYYGIDLSFIIPRGSAMGGDSIYFGEPLLWKIFQKIIFPNMLENQDLAAHPLSIAAWFSLIATALNLLPLGQLDGGHIIYAIFGNNSFIIYRFFFLLLIVLTMIWPYWAIWVIIAFFIGLRHPPVLDETEGIGTGRRILAIVAAVIFVLSFVIIPISG